MEGKTDEAGVERDDAEMADASGEAATDGELERAREELAAVNDRLLRLAAEFDNYRKRTERERAETWTRSQADLAATLLDVLDDLGRVAHLEAESVSVPSLLDGVQLVERKLQRALAAAGLEEVDPAEQRFDPASMEALMMVDAENEEQDDVVAGVMQKGYRFKGHLLRPARVQVRKFNG